MAGIYDWTPNGWAAAARRSAARHGLDPAVFTRQMSTESIGFSRDVIFGRTSSPAGAQGIAQFMPATARGVGVNPLHPRQALDAAAKLMAGYVRKYGNYHDALVAYNAGPGRVGGSLPAETQNYVRRILRGQDPGKLGAPQTNVGDGRAGGGRGGPQAGTQGAQGPNLGSGSDIVTKLAAALQTTRTQGVGASAPTPPAFAAHAPSAAAQVPTAGVTPAAPQSSLSSQLQQVLASVDQAQGVGQAGGGGRRQAAPRGVQGRTLYIGDSLGVGTEPNLKKLLGGHVDADVVGGRSSENGIAALQKLYARRGYQNIVLDLGTNDMTAQQLARSVQRARKIAPDARVFIPTLNGPYATRQKNALLHRIAERDPNVTLVGWHSHAQGHLAGDGIHATAQGYEARARLIASKLGWEPATGGRGKFSVTGPDPGRIKPVVVGFARRVAAVYGKPLVGSDGSGHSRLTVNGNVSEHTTGNAVDIPLAGAALVAAGRAALVAAGWSRARARKVSGGLFNVYQVVNGKRVRHQIVFNTMEGGDHTGHLHISSAYR